MYLQNYFFFEDITIFYMKNLLLIINKAQNKKNAHSYSAKIYN